jgi:hypothetical protein
MTNWKFILYRARWDLATVDLVENLQRNGRVSHFREKFKEVKQENLTKMMA